MESKRHRRRLVIAGVDLQRFFFPPYDNGDALYAFTWQANALVFTLGTHIISSYPCSRTLTLRRLMSYIYIYIWSTHS